MVEDIRVNIETWAYNEVDRLRAEVERLRAELTFGRVVAKTSDDSILYSLKRSDIGDVWRLLDDVRRPGEPAPAVVARLKAEVGRLRERAERAEAALKPFADFLAWIEAAVEIGDVAPIADDTCVASLMAGGGSNYIWVGDLRRAAQALAGLDAAPVGEETPP